MEAAERRWFEQATLPHLDAAYNLARWLTHEEHAAEDVVQEAYARAARYFSSFRGGEARPWLLAIVRRAAYDWLAQRQDQPAIPFDPDAHDPRDDSADPAVLALRRCDQAQVRQALEELPPPLREVIVLRELEGLTYHEIATVSAVPLGTVMSRLSRGRAQLQRRLAPYAEGVG